MLRKIFSFQRRWAELRSRVIGPRRSKNTDSFDVRRPSRSNGGPNCRKLAVKNRLNSVMHMTQGKNPLEIAGFFGNFQSFRLGFQFFFGKVKPWQSPEKNLTFRPRIKPADFCQTLLSENPVYLDNRIEKVLSLGFAFMEIENLHLYVCVYTQNR